MSTDRALLAAVLERPDDDAPRLVYADWLEENGEPERAEFIRVECEGAGTDRDSPAYPKWLRRSGELMAGHADRWFGPLTDGRVAEHVITSRGFVDSVVISADGFTTHAGAIFAHAPLLRGLHVTAGGDWHAFFASPWMPAIRALSFKPGVFTADAARALAASDHTRALVELDLDGQPLGPRGMAALARARLWCLEKLSASDSGLGDEGAQRLFDRKGFRSVRDLDLSDNGLTDEACRSLAAAPHFGRLERLVLCNNYISGSGVAALAGSPHLAGLRRLNLYSNPVGRAGGRAILAWRLWDGLTELNLEGCGVGVEVMNDLRRVYGQRAVKA